jgi:hypothetical protein
VRLIIRFVRSTDRPGWSFTSGRAIVACIPMAVLPYAWGWPDAIARGPGETFPADAP